MKTLRTERLTLRPLTIDDAAFLLDLLNDPDWLHFIGDRGVRTLEDAQTYLANGPMQLYERHGFGPLVVERTGEGVPMGTCGLIKRDTLEDVDIGYAFLPAFRGKGYALESARAVLASAHDVPGLTRVVAITTEDNDSSGRLLEKLGMRFDRLVRLGEDETLLRFYVVDLPATPPTK